MESNRQGQVARILVVEDDPMVAEVLRQALAADGHDVEHCDSAERAMHLIGNEHFPVVITDLRLPDGLGTEILNRNRRVHPQSAVIVITGDSHFATAAEAVQQGAYGYIPKPFQPESVRHQVAQALRQAQLVRERDHYKHLAMTDPLTQLGNRRKFDLILEGEIERGRRYQHSLSLLAVDIDRLKECNDRLGHAAGDEVIRTIAALLSRSVRRVDLVARYGGDEFMVVLPETSADGAAVAAGRYCLAAASMENAPWDLSISVGRATCPDDAKTAEDLIDIADRCMYQAKEQGGGRYHPE